MLEAKSKTRYQTVESIFQKKKPSTKISIEYERHIFGIPTYEALIHKHQTTDTTTLTPSRRHW
jgi:hypothetical protein